MMLAEIKLEERVIQLHDIARQIEQTIGKGELSEDIRKIADRLNELLK
jgi:hypothetical protein